jgi:hypothetical protein
MSRAWLLTALERDARQYQGNFGYDDEHQAVYRFDSNVPNHKKVETGDVVFLRAADTVFGRAVVVRLLAEPGTKLLKRCPTCRGTSLKIRKSRTPAFRCQQCRHETDSPVVEAVRVTNFACYFDDTFTPIEPHLPRNLFWDAAVRLNKQLAMLELDIWKLKHIVGEVEPVNSAEGRRRRAVFVGIEQNQEARQACVRHYGSDCFVCGFNFGRTYGQGWEGLIEIHHLELPVDREVVGVADPIRDLRPLCSNCHRAVHLSNPPIHMSKLMGFRGLHERP